MTELQKQLSALADSDYAAFQSKLLPTVDRKSILGVRLPVLRRFAAAYAKTPEAETFLRTLPHEFFDENLLHAILLEKYRPYEVCVELTEAFLPYVDNWSVCDTIRPRIFAKRKEAVLEKIHEWLATGRPYTCRFALDMLMTHFLDEAFRPEYLELPLTVDSDDYYVRMMTAWYYATALAKQWDAAVPYLEDHRLPEWVHRKTVQKACESYRLTDEQKQYLKKIP